MNMNMSMITGPAYKNNMKHPLAKDPDTNKYPGFVPQAMIPHPLVTYVTLDLRSHWLLGSEVRVDGKYTPSSRMTRDSPWHRRFYPVKRSEADIIWRNAAVASQAMTSTS